MARSREIARAPGRRALARRLLWASGMVTPIEGNASTTLALAERVMLDALALEVGPDRAPSVLQTSLARTRTPMPEADDAQAISGFVRGPLRASLCRELGPKVSDEVVRSAQALLAPLQRDRLLAGRPAFRAPYVLVSDRRNDLEGAIELRRVTGVLDLMLEADAMPEATIVLDTTTSALSLVTLAATVAELPERTRIVIVGASDADRAVFEQLSTRCATFVDVFLPLGLNLPGVDAPLRRAA